MGFFDKLMGKKTEAAAAPKPEAKRPPAMPGQRESLVKREGKIKALRADAQYVTTKEANQFLATRFQELSQELEARRKSNLPTAELDAEAAQLNAFKSKVDARMDAPDAREQLYEGKEILVENPYYQTAPEALSESDIVETVPDIDQQREELVDLMYRRDQLTKQRDELMKQVKETVSTPKEWEISGRKAHAEAVDQKAIYPNYFPENIANANAADKMRAEAAALEKTSAESRQGLSEPLRKVLDELDDVQEQIASKKRNIEFAEKKYGAADKREAA